jgi:hypothetical protein
MAASLRERIAVHESAHVVAALTFGIPIVAVHIGDQPHLHRGRWRAPPGLGREAMLTLCFAGAEAEKIYCAGPIADGSDAGDLRMAREIAARSFPNPLQAAAELARCRDARPSGAFGMGAAAHRGARRRPAPARQSGRPADLPTEP